MIEICDQEFDSYIKKMIDWSYNNYVTQKDKRCITKSLANTNKTNVYCPTTTEVRKSKTDYLKALYEFKVLLRRNWLQMFRDKVSSINFDFND